VNDLRAVATLKAVTAKPDVQLRAREPEAPRRLRLVPVGLAQHVFDCLPLDDAQAPQVAGFGAVARRRGIRPLDPQYDSGGVGVGVLESVSAEAHVQLRARQSQTLRRLRFVPIGLAQHAFDRLTFNGDQVVL
jgi:hypothetical protein